ncbi:MAG: cupredoxin domain-containing protein [Nitrosopumilus sp.]|nr:cupredoxin domain-containing protein [Nitrosopumilus sp.]
MIKKITIIAIITVIILVTIGLILSNDSTEKNSEESELIVKGDVIMPTKVSRPGCEEIDRCYIPSVIVIDSGKQVTWVNQDSAFHSVTSGFYGEPTELFDSGHLDPFESYTVDFDETGTYDYFCTLHPWMKGQVIVE